MLLDFFPTQVNVDSMRSVLWTLCLAVLTSATVAQETKKDAGKGTAGYSKDVTDSHDEDSLIPVPKTVTRNLDRVPVPADAQEVVLKQFGKEFLIMTELPAPFLTGDFDGDGVQDAAVIVRAHHPLAQKGEFDFIAFSPEDEYYGYGDPKVMTGTEWERWEDRKLILVIHGEGKDAWRSEHPKGKFLLLNLPFNTFYVMSTKIKKKPQDVIAGESSVMSSIVYWTGKKYKYDPMSAVD